MGSQLNMRRVEDAAAMTACSRRLQWVVALSHQRLGSPTDHVHWPVPCTDQF